MRSAFGIDTRVVFPNAWLGVQVFHSGSGLVFFSTNLRGGILVGFSDFRVSGFSCFRYGFGLISSVFVPDTRAGFPNVGVVVQDFHYEQILVILIEFMGRHFGACCTFRILTCLLYVYCIFSVGYPL